MPAFSGTFESPIIPVRGVFTSLIVSEAAEPTSTLQTTPDGAEDVYLSFGTNGIQSPETKLNFELYEDIEGIYLKLKEFTFQNDGNKIETLKENAKTLPALPYHWRVKVIQGSPLSAVYVNFQYI